MAENYRLRLGLAALVVIAFLVFAYTNGPASLEPGEARPPKVVAKAIDRFSDEFPGQVGDVEKVVVPESIDGSAVAVWVESDLEIVDSVDSGEPFWQVVRVSKLAEYWIVEMQSEGESFFGGEVYLQVDNNGDVFRVSPDDLGVTATTAIS